VALNEYGFVIIADNISVQVLVTTQPQNIKKLEPELHSKWPIEHKYLDSY